MPFVSIQITALSYTYVNRTAPALNDVTLNLRAGEVTLIAGESGSGKTTLFRCVNGLIPHSYRNGVYTGTVQIKQESTASLSLAQLARRIGTVLQDPEKQMVAAQVRHDIAFGLENMGVPRAEILTRIAEVAAHLHIEHLLERPTHTLSGGERQKVAIAGVLIMRPQVLLFDEPLASLDPRSAREALSLFRKLAKGGVAVVLIEHRVRTALQIVPEHCVELARGEIVFQGNAVDFAARHTKPEAAKPLKHRTSNSAALLALRNAQFAYPDRASTIRDVSVTIYPGDVVALMGPNGAGKSTLSRLAIGLLRPDSGDVLIDQQPTANMSVAQMARHVGYVFQHPSTMLFANTLHEELSFGPRNIGLNPETIQHNVTQAMQVVNLAGLPLDRSPFALSYGQQKRVTIASVLAMQPCLLFLDEPTAGLDDATAQHLMEALLHAAYRPQALVLITHDVALARTYANRVLLLVEGQLIADDSPDAVLNNPVLLEKGHLQ